MMIEATPKGTRMASRRYRVEVRFAFDLTPRGTQAGWEVYWTWRSIHSPAGFPDLVLCPTARCLVPSAQRRVKFREVKTLRDRLKPAQRRWLWLLEQAGADVGTWRPDQWDAIRQELGYLDE